MTQAALHFRAVPKHEAAWRVFRAENPDVFRHFARFALQLLATGRERIGAKAVWERLRWELALTTRGDDFKLNNNHTAYAARDFMREHPEHDGCFALRRTH